MQACWVHVRCLHDVEGNDIHVEALIMQIRHGSNGLDSFCLYQANIVKQDWFYLNLALA